MRIRRAAGEADNLDSGHHMWIKTSRKELINPQQVISSQQWLYGNFIVSVELIYSYPRLERTKRHFGPFMGLHLVFQSQAVGRSKWYWDLVLGPLLVPLFSPQG